MIATEKTSFLFLDGTRVHELFALNVFSSVAGGYAGPQQHQPQQQPPKPAAFPAPQQEPMDPAQRFPMDARPGMQERVLWEHQRHLQQQRERELQQLREREQREREQREQREQQIREQREQQLREREQREREQREMEQLGRSRKNLLKVLMSVRNNQSTQYCTY